MYELLLTLHWLNRYIALILLLALIINSTIKFMGKKKFSPIDNKLSIATVIDIHIQLTLGVILYLTSPLVMFNGVALKQSPIIRYYTVEHMPLMILAIVFITIGRVLAKKRQKKIVNGDETRSHLPHKTLLIFNAIGLIIIIITLGQNKILI